MNDMNMKVAQALNAALTNWNAMSGSGEDEAESAADRFEASFYLLIDAVRDWVDGLDPRPRTLEQLYRLPTVETIVERLPAPLQLNFETEAELIIDNIRRVDEDKYDS